MKNNLLQHVQRLRNVAAMRVRNSESGLGCGSFAETENHTHYLDAGFAPRGASAGETPAYPYSESVRRSPLVSFSRLAAMLLLLITMGICNALGASVTWEKVTSAPSDWSGEYLIVYNSQAYDGSLTSNFDASNNYQSVTIKDGKITLDDTYSFTLAAVTGGYSLQNAAGYYLGRNANSNGMDNATTYNSNLIITITWSSTNKNAKLASKGGRCLGNNSGRWRFFASSNAYVNVDLYKKAATCSNKVALTKGEENNGSFSLDKADGSYDNCDDDFVVTVSSITPDPGYVFDEITVSGADGKYAIAGPDGSGNYTVTYTKDNNITNTSITVTFKQACATPTFSPAAGTYNNNQSVAISSTTTGATIYYTTNGSTPTTSSSTYSSAITVSSDNTTIKAIAVKSGMDNSNVGSATYRLKCATPTFSVAAGVYSETQSVTLSCATTDATIRYTTDGSTPTASSTAYTSAISVSSTTTIKAIAFKTNYQNSDEASATYTIMDCDWYESFDQVTNTAGPNASYSQWSGISTTGGVTTDNSGWTINAGGYGGSGCIKAGTGSTAGTAQTPSITVDNGAHGTVTFRMGAWDSGSAKLSLSGAIVGTSGSTTTWQSASAMTASQWNDYEVEFTTNSTSLQITFSSTGNRFWLDEVCVKMDAASYTVSFDANGHGTAPSAIENVAKNATINSSKPADPTATGWTFGGWYKEPGCTNAWNWESDQVTSDITLYAKWTCANPTSLSIAATGSKWDYCAGESMTLTVSGSNIGTGATYQWKLGDANIPGATSASYTTTMAAAKAGKYTCTVSNGTCSASAEAWVRVWTLYINNGASDAFQELDFTNTGTNTGSNTTVDLSADKTYQFKLKDNTDGWFGVNDKTITGTESNITLNGTGNNVNLSTGFGGNYTFAINYADKNNPKVSVTYPTANQAAGKKIWFDNSVRGWSSMYYRIGHGSYSMSREITSAMLVTGTDRFYEYTTTQFDGLAAWQIANNKSQNDGNTSIYTVNGGQNITESIVHQKYTVGDDGVTLVPTTSTGSSDGCTWYAVSKTDGMLKHTATITTPTNGTISLAYTSKSGSPSTATVSDLPHRSYITATATPATGYQLSTFTVTPAGGSATSLVATNGQTNNHILATDATFAATFTAKNITITWDANGGSVSPSTSSYTYNGSTVSLPTPTHATKVFAGWWTLDEGGTQITEIGTTNKPSEDVTYYAHWSDGNTVYFNASPGTASVPSATQTTLGGTVTLATATIDCDGWSFAGWKVGSQQTETTTNPESGLLAGGATYTPTSASVQMYAVWKKNFGGGTGDVTSTYDWDSNTTGWTSAGSTQSSGGVDNSKYTSLGGTGYMPYNSSVKVKGFSFAFKLSSNNTKGTIKVQKATNSTFTSGLTDVRTWTISSMEASSSSWKTYSTESTDFDGKTNYYVRLAYIQDGNSTVSRYFDNLVVTYVGTIPDSWKWTSTPAGCTPANQVKTPVISPATEAQTGDVSVSITCATDGAIIYYTTDGTDPTTSSSVYSSAFTVSCSTTVKAFATKTSMTDSEIASQAYTITVPTPTISLAAGTYYDANQTVTLSLPTTHTGTVIKYTTNGDKPTSSSATYSSAITVTEGTTTIKAIGYNSTCSASSAVASATYVVRMGETFTLVTNAEDLNAGDRVVLVSADATTSTHHAVSTSISSNKRTATTDFNLAAGLATATIYPAVGGAATVQVFTLGGKPDEWTFHETTNNGYLNCPSAGKLTNTATVSNSNKWTISITSNVATIQNNDVTDAAIKSNTSSQHVFAAYGSSTQNVELIKIYSVPNPEPVLKVEATLTAFSACRGIAGDAQSFYVSGKNLDAAIVISGPAGYEFCLTEDGTYASTLSLTPTSKTVAKTLVYVRLAASATAGAHNGNLNAAVSANSLSQDVAVTGTVSVADEYVDRIHNQTIANQCGTYTAPSCTDTSAPTTETDCVTTHYRFMGWVTAADIADGFNSDADYIADLITAGTARTADGTTYYAVWAKEED